MWAIKHFRSYLYGTKFILYTDYQPFKWLMPNDKLTGKLACWTIILQEYKFDVIHRPSVTYQNVDTIFKSSLITSEDISDTRQDFDELALTARPHATSYLILLQCYVVGQLVLNIWKDLDTLRLLQHERYSFQVTSG